MLRSVRVGRDGQAWAICDVDDRSVPVLASVSANERIGESVVPARLLYSARSLQDVIYCAELSRATDGVRVDLALTRAWPSDWTGLIGRVDSQAVQRITFSAPERPWVYICGPTGFVESVSASMVKAGHPPERIKTERFGPSGAGTP